jgi:hypothetical protein
MASNIDFEIKTGTLEYSADAVWLDDQEIEREVESEAWASSDQRIVVAPDGDKQIIQIPDTSAFQPGDQVVVSVTADAKFGPDVKPIILECIFTAMAPATPEATHGNLTVTLKP